MGATAGPGRCCCGLRVAARRLRRRRADRIERLCRCGGGHGGRNRRRATPRRDARCAGRPGFLKRTDSSLDGAAPTRPYVRRREADSESSRSCSRGAVPWVCAAVPMLPKKEVCSRPYSDGAATAPPSSAAGVRRIPVPGTRVRTRCEADASRPCGGWISIRADAFQSACGGGSALVD